MEDHNFNAKNDLEAQLLQAQQGLIGPDVFVKMLLESQVFLPILDKHHIAGFQDSDKAKLLTVPAEDGSEVLVMFTSPERAKGFVQQYPGYEGGILAEFIWVLEKTGAAISISLNPGWDVGMEMEPEMLRQLLQQH